MELLNFTSNFLSQGWSYYLEIMNHFNMPRPDLALLAFLLAVIFLTIISLFMPKTKRKPKIGAFDFKARIENPAWYSKVIIWVIERGVFLPLVITLQFLILSMLKAAVTLYFIVKIAFLSLQLRRKNKF